MESQNKMHKLIKEISQKKLTITISDKLQTPIPKYYLHVNFEIIIKNSNKFLKWWYKEQPNQNKLIKNNKFLNENTKQFKTLTAKSLTKQLISVFTLYFDHSNEKYSLEDAGLELARTTITK